MTDPEHANSSSHAVTLALRRMEQGDRAAADEVMALLYDDLKTVARAQFRRERPGHTLQPTAVVHEACLRLLAAGPATFEDRTHFLGIAARVMRQVLVDHARQRRADKRGADWTRVSLSGASAQAAGASHDVDVLELDELLRSLRALDGRQADVVELRYFGGLTVPEIAAFLGVARSTVDADWAVARAWLGARLRP